MRDPGVADGVVLVRLAAGYADRADNGTVVADRDAALHRHAKQVLRAGRTAPGHVVNLGHGVPPDTDPDVRFRKGTQRRRTR